MVEGHRFDQAHLCQMAQFAVLIKKSPVSFVVEKGLCGARPVLLAPQKGLEVPCSLPTGGRDEQSQDEGLWFEVLGVRVAIRVRV